MWGCRPSTKARPQSLSSQREAGLSPRAPFLSRRTNPSFVTLTCQGTTSVARPEQAPTGARCASNGCRKPPKTRRLQPLKPHSFRLINLSFVTLTCQGTTFSRAIKRQNNLGLQPRAPFPSRRTNLSFVTLTCQGTTFSRAIKRQNNPGASAPEPHSFSGS